MKDKRFPDYWGFPERLKKEMKLQKLSYTSLASKIGVSRPAVATWITRNTPPTLDTAAKIADLLNVSLDYLCGRTPYKETNRFVEKVKEKQKDDFVDLIKQMQPDDWLFLLRQLEVRLIEVKERNKQT